MKAPEQPVSHVRFMPSPKRQVLAGAALATFAGVSTVAGIFSQLLQASYFGTTGRMDAYIAVSALPLLLMGVTAPVMIYGLVPAIVTADVAGRGAELIKLSLIHI